MTAMWVLAVVLDGLVFLGNDIYDTKAQCEKYQAGVEKIAEVATCFDLAEVPDGPFSDAPERVPGPNGKMPREDEPVEPEDGPPGPQDETDG